MNLDHLKSNNQIDCYFLHLAYQYAKEFSPDPRTQNGAVLVHPDTLAIISYGANRFPAGVKPLAERLQPHIKRDYLEHAERDAIFSAIKNGKATQGTILYVPWFACADCAKAIIGAGISVVVGHFAPCSATTPWTPSIKIGLTLLEEAKLQYRYYDGEVGVQNLRFAGEIVNR